MKNFNSRLEIPPLIDSQLIENQSERSINELPEEFVGIFSDRFQCFNRIQSFLFDVILKTHQSLGRKINFNIC